MWPPGHPAMIAPMPDLGVSWTSTGSGPTQPVRNRGVSGGGSGNSPRNGDLGFGVSYAGVGRVDPGGPHAPDTPARSYAHRAGAGGRREPGPAHPDGQGMAPARLRAVGR